MPPKVLAVAARLYTAGIVPIKLQQPRPYDKVASRMLPATIISSYSNSKRGRTSRPEFSGENKTKPASYSYLRTGNGPIKMHLYLKQENCVREEVNELCFG